MGQRPTKVDKSSGREVALVDEEIYSLLEQQSDLEDSETYNFYQLYSCHTQEWCQDLLAAGRQQTGIKVENGLKATLEQRKVQSEDNGIDLYLRLHDILLGLLHWKEDIGLKIENEEGPLSTLEQRNSPRLNMLGMQLRRDFQNLLRILCLLMSNSEEPTSPYKGYEGQTQNESDLLSELERTIGSLKAFVDPLRMHSEIEGNYGNVGIVRNEFNSIRKSRLSNSIATHFVESRFDRKLDFVPEGTIERLVTDEVVKAELGFWSKAPEERDKHTSLVDFTRKSAKMLFAISIEIGLKGPDLYTAMKIFKDHNPPVTDCDLPIPSNDDVDPSTPAPILAEIDRKGSVWGTARQKKFCETQWKFLVPVFETKTLIYPLQPRSILPFIERYHDEGGSGGFGKVFKVKIHENHLKDTGKTLDGLPQFLAIKQIHAAPFNPATKKAMSEIWEHEAETLQQANKLTEGREHIVRFITAFCGETQAGQEHYYLMYEWADGGSLRNLWKQDQKSRLSASLVKDTIYQLYGLTKAIWAAHYENKSIRHGDLKPENILCFRGKGSIGTLKICDWGLAKAKESTERTGMAVTTTGLGTMSYESPEACPPPGIPRVVSRLKDIWAMGCIILEFVIWILEGYEGLQKFSSAFTKKDISKRFFSWGPGLGSQESVVHEIVRNKIASIKEDIHCREGTAIRDLINLVSTRLLVTDLPPTNASLSGTHTRNSRHPHSLHRRSTMDIAIEDDGESSEKGIESLPESPIMATEAAEVPVVKITHEESDRETQTPEPKRTNEQRGLFRALATELRDELKRMAGKADIDESYCFTGTTIAEVVSITSGSAVEATHSNAIHADSGYPSGSRPDMAWDKSGFLAPQQHQDIVRNPEIPEK